MRRIVHVQAARVSTIRRLAHAAHPRKSQNKSTQPPNLNAATPPPSPRQTRPPPPGVAPRGIFGLGPVSLTLVMLVLSGVGWFGYRYYRLSTIYPAPIRAALRVGLAAMLKQEYEQAEIAFRRALEMAYATSPSELSPDPHIKLTGIAVKLGEALELSGKKSSALHLYIQTLAQLFPQFNVYKDDDDESKDNRTFNEDGTLDKQFRKETKHPDWKHVPLGGKSRLRAVGLANRAAMLAEGLQTTNTLPPLAPFAEWTKSWNAMELYLRTFSVTQILYLASNTTGIPTSELSTSPELDSKLPKWLNRLDLAAPCEGLAEYYVRNKDISLALPLYQTTYHFLLPTTIASSSTDSTISTTTPLANVSHTPSDPTMMCMAAQVLTAMSAAVMGLDSPRRLMGLAPPSSSKMTIPTSEKSNADEAPSANIKAVRSWARESRRLVDLGRRVHGKADYLYLMEGIEVLGREEPTSKSKPQPTDDSTVVEDNEGLDKDEKLVRLDLKRIQEGNRRWKEAAFKQQVNSIGMKSPTSADRESAAVKVAKWGDDPGLKGNTICERTWAVVLYNTGMVEAFDGNTSIAEQYLQLALEQSRRINLLEGVQKSKAALRDLVSGSNRR